MSIESKRELKGHRQLTFSMFLIGLALSILAFIYIFQTEENGRDHIVEEWSIQWTAREQPIVSNMPIDLQVIALEGGHLWITEGDVRANLSHSKMHEDKSITFHHVEDGLYEVQTSFPYAGIWKGELYIKKSGNKVSIPMEVNVLPPR
ncbi:hypothetical protein [Evansella cellulosilytica]|uniref:FixH family protein n=1 Tax=Evansella cellulosilytica (strain ATCC 21833 / DSM 2522 / FERM P-1141 / JCM 9156 / N-4) TaxID=649639 RepID=E6TTL3_EVAC2|nr:hypothetical protein [Evansella cellulosilytica]ADU29649.1 hypothetical protein Bcell_1384 [Evansella cellulosilytica DSM 2522]